MATNPFRLVASASERVDVAVVVVAATAASANFGQTIYPAMLLANAGCWIVNAACLMLSWLQRPEF